MFHLLGTELMSTQSKAEQLHLLVTGATGFVGCALVRRLLKDNARVTAAILEGEDASHLPADVERVVVAPLSGESDYWPVLKQVDILIHLAARVHIMLDTAADPLQEFRQVNLHGTERLARQAASAGVQRIVFVSSVKVHGEEASMPYREESPFAPLDAYGVSKAEAEHALEKVAADTGLDVVVVRSPLVYGPGVKANFRQLMNIVSRRIPLPFLSISNMRSLIFVENLADALVCCATHPNAAGKSFLVSDGEDVSTPELIRRIAGTLDVPARLLPFSIPLMRLAGKVVGKSCAVSRLTGSLAVDSSRIRKDLGWRPPFSMSQGLKETADWFRKEMRK